MKKTKANSCWVTLKFELSDTEKVIKGGREVSLPAAIALLWIILRRAVERRKREEKRTKITRNQDNINLPVHEINTLGED